MGRRRWRVWRSLNGHESESWKQTKADLKPSTCRSPEGVRFSAEVNDGAGTPPVKIENNRIVAENGETYAATQSADESKLTVKNVKSGRLLLEAEFLNRTTVRVRGVFGCLGLAAIPVENDEPIPGVLMHHFCSMNSRTGIAVN